MHVAESLGQRGRQPQHDRNRRWPALADRLGQRGARDVSRGQPRRRAVQVCVDHRRHERGANRPGGGHLGLEPGIGGQLGGDRLHRDRLSVRRQAEIHAAVPELPEQTVRPERARIVSLKRRDHLILTPNGRYAPLAPNSTAAP
jgi:hypothetical protein